MQCGGGHGPVDRIGQAGDLAAVVADQDRPAGGGDLGDDLRDQGAGLGVEPLPRLVEDEQAGRGEQSLGQADFLRRAFGERAERCPGVRGQAETLDPVVRGGGRDAAQGGHRVQVAARGERLVGRKPLGDPADDRRTVADRTPCRPQDSGSQLQQGGLSGAVGAEHDHGLPRGHAHAGVVQCPGGAPGVPEPDPVEKHGRKDCTKKPPGTSPGAFVRSAIGDQPCASPRRFFTAFGSTWMPGPVVVEKVTFFRYLPFAADGLDRRTSSSTAA